ncbi:hypothetical protein IE077_000113 [Cardiosporidium cionae]|uniref:AP2/ERF domain-containing protein n=1 Tax=Cardiosporidium cionae TaxID=476202 RepID=A0ABQ7JDN2_9APIC|nr:hypothetical protein IE077_000113 [Cardiosporidium cionae]|eukprot:KAF8822015.1 hypothetical protein IE077_000113 [Cardiosporidium cionae]
MKLDTSESDTHPIKSSDLKNHRPIPPNAPRVTTVPDEHYYCNVPGVYYHFSKGEWRLVYRDPQCRNKRIQKTYSIRKYGFYGAKEKAVEFKHCIDLQTPPGSLSRKRSAPKKMTSPKIETNFRMLSEPTCYPFPFTSTESDIPQYIPVSDFLSDRNISQQSTVEKIEDPSYPRFGSAFSHAFDTAADISHGSALLDAYNDKSPFQGLFASNSINPSLEPSLLWSHEATNGMTEAMIGNSSYPPSTLPSYGPSSMRDASMAQFSSLNEMPAEAYPPQMGTNIFERWSPILTMPFAIPSAVSNVSEISTNDSFGGDSSFFMNPSMKGALEGASDVLMTRNGEPNVDYYSSTSSLPPKKRSVQQIPSPTSPLRERWGIPSPLAGERVYGMSAAPSSSPSPFGVKNESTSSVFYMDSVNSVPSTMRYNPFRDPPSTPLATTASHFISRNTVVSISDSTVSSQVFMCPPVEDGRNSNASLHLEASMYGEKDGKLSPQPHLPNPFLSRGSTISSPYPSLSTFSPTASTARYSASQNSSPFSTVTDGLSISPIASPDPFMADFRSCLHETTGQLFPQSSASSLCDFPTNFTFTEPARTMTGIPFSQALQREALSAPVIISSAYHEQKISTPSERGWPQSPFLPEGGTWTETRIAPPSLPTKVTFQQLEKRVQPYRQREDRTSPAGFAHFNPNYLIG